MAYIYIIYIILYYIVLYCICQNILYTIYNAIFVCIYVYIHIHTNTMNEWTCKWRNYGSTGDVNCPHQSATVVKIAGCLSISLLPFAHGKRLHSQTPLQVGVAMWLNPGWWDMNGSDVCNFGVVLLKGRRRVPAPSPCPPADWNVDTRAGGGAAILGYKGEGGRATR